MPKRESRSIHMVPVLDIGKNAGRFDVLKSGSLKISWTTLVLSGAAGAILLSVGVSPSAKADYGTPGTKTLRDPLVPGASFADPGQPAAPGAPPPIGCGAVPTPITPGQTNGPTFEPWASRIPANQIDQPNSCVALPYGPPDALPPGVAGQLGDPPPPPSTPGPDRGMLRNPPGVGSAAAIVTPDANGRYPDDAAPTMPRGGKTTRDFGLNRTSVRDRQSSFLTDFGERLEKKPPAVRPEYSQDGPKPVPPRGRAPQVTHDLYGAPMLSRTNEGLTPLTTIAPY